MFGLKTMIYFFLNFENSNVGRKYILIEVMHKYDPGKIEEWHFAFL